MQLHANKTYDFQYLLMYIFLFTFYNSLLTTDF